MGYLDLRAVVAVEPSSLTSAEMVSSPKVTFKSEMGGEHCKAHLTRVPTGTEKSRFSTVASGFSKYSGKIRVALV